MLRNAFIIACASLSLASVAQQLPNSGFENWVTHAETSAEVPQAPWEVVTEYTVMPPTPSYIVTGTKSTDKRNGNFALSLTPEVDGIATAVILQTPFTPITTKPLYFEGYYKYDAFSGDQVQVEVKVYKSNADPNNPTLLGEGETIIATDKTVYTRFALPIDYSNTVITPDRIAIVFRMVGNEGNEGTTLLVDDFALGYSPLESTWDGLNSTQGLEINSNYVGFTDADSRATFEVMDMMGKVLISAPDAHNIQFQDIPSGSYLVKISNESGRNQIVKVIH